MNTASQRNPRITGGMANNGEVLLNIPAHLVKDLQKAAQDVPYALSSAAHIFGMIHRLWIRPGKSRVVRPQRILRAWLELNGGH